MTVIILDVETTGLPIGRNANYRDLSKYENARIVQMSYMICDQNTFEEIAMKDYIIKSDGFSINNSQFHWVTDEISLSQGVPFIDVAREFAKDLVDASHILAHNAEFDVNIIKSELCRYGFEEVIEVFDKKTIVCTMKSTMQMVNVRNKYGVKFPTLSELYAFVFPDSVLEHAHNAKYDVINLQSIVKKLHEMKQLTI